MNTALWVVQGILALAFFAAGAFKLVTPRQKLAVKQKWVETSTDGQVKLIGLAEVAGAFGLIVPWKTGILPVLTPIAAICLVVIMIGAARTHLRLKESAVPPLVLAVLCAFVVAGRLGHL